MFFVQTLKNLFKVNLLGKCLGGEKVQEFHVEGKMSK